jgi:hypothetical protein
MESLCESVLKEGDPAVGYIRDEPAAEVVVGFVEVALVVLIFPVMKAKAQGVCSKYKLKSSDPLDCSPNVPVMVSPYNFFPTLTMFSIYFLWFIVTLIKA